MSCSFLRRVVSGAAILSGELSMSLFTFRGTDFEQVQLNIKKER